MYKFLRNLSCLLCLILVFGGCRKKAFDAYYGRPASLAPPIYTVLQKRGNFTNLLKLIDRSGYKATLSAGGFWTFFAPNDAAFNTYFTNNPDGITSVDKISDSLANVMVTYCLVFNGFATDHLADYQSPTGYIPATAFRRRTAYHDGFQYFNNKSLASIIPTDNVWVAENRDIIQGNIAYVYGDNNNKYIPYFYSTFMDAQGLSAADYNYFYPDVPYTGFNVAGSSVVNKDINAENGTIHEIDHVLTPLRSIEKILEKETDYSLFRSIFENYLVTYTPDAAYTRQFNTVTGKSNTVVVKNYNGALPYALGNESYIKFEPNDSQRDGYTLFAPKNGPFKHYLNSVIFKYYRQQAPALDTMTDADMTANLNRLPVSVITDLMGTHMYQSVVFRSKFNSILNLQKETPGFDPSSTDIAYKELGSNGAFYGVNKVHAANVFSTVYGRLYLDPSYSISYRLISSNLAFKAQITDPGKNYTLFAVPDAAFAALGYGYDAVNNVYTQTVNGVKTTGGIPQAAMKAILQVNIVPGKRITDLSGNGVAETYTTDGGTALYIRWHNNTVASGATVEQNQILTIDPIHPFDDYSNGRVYYLTNNAILQTQPITSTIYAGLLKNGTLSTDPYYDFVQYLKTSGAYNPGTLDILGADPLSHNYTVFVPTHSAMEQAVRDGLLPGTVAPGGAVTFTYNPTSTDDKTRVTQFLQYHFVSGTTIAPDGTKPGVSLVGTFDTMLKDVTGKAIPVYVHNEPAAIDANGVVTGFYIRDNGGNPNVTLIAPNNNSYFPATSNYVGNNVMYHQISNYLSPTKIH